MSIDNLLLPSYLGLRQCRHGTMLYPRFDRYIGKALEVYGEFSEGECEFFQQVVQPGQIVVEIGANIGAHTVMLAKIVGQGGAVFAFEPQSVLFQILAANLALNALRWVRPIQVGIGNISSTLKLPFINYDSPNNFGAFQLSHEGVETVEVRTLDSYNLKKLDFLKIDVEGAEKSVLEGAWRTVEKHRPLIYVENDRIEHSKALIEYIKDMKYRLWWHFPPMYNPNNYNQISENIFGRTVSANMMCIPVERNGIVALREVKDANETWLDVANEENYWV